MLERCRLCVQVSAGPVSASEIGRPILLPDFYVESYRKRYRWQKTIQPVTILKLSPTHFVSNISHQQRCSRDDSFWWLTWNRKISSRVCRFKIRFGYAHGLTCLTCEIIERFTIFHDCSIHEIQHNWPILKSNSIFFENSRIFSKIYIFISWRCTFCCAIIITCLQCYLYKKGSCCAVLAFKLKTINIPMVFQWCSNVVAMFLQCSCDVV